MMSPSQRSIAAANLGSFICSPASSSFIERSRTSMSSVSTSARFFVSSKTKRATFSLCLPWRAVPRIIGIKSGRSDLVGMLISSDTELQLLAIRDRQSAFRNEICRWPDSNRHGPFKAQRILSPLRLPFRHIGVFHSETPFLPMKTASFAIFIVSSFVGEKYGKLLENVAMDSNEASRSAATTAKSLRDALRVLNVSGWPEQPQIAGVADDAIDAAGDQCMPGLDGDQPAEPMPKDKDGPKPERTTGNEERDTNPASCVAVDRPKLLSVRAGWQIRVQTGR